MLLGDENNVGQKVEKITEQSKNKLETKMALRMSQKDIWEKLRG